MNEQWAGAVMFADCHFASAEKKLNSVKLHASVAKNRVEEGTNGEGLVLPSNREKSYQEAVKQARHRVELPFGIWKTKWKALAKPWPKTDL